MGLLGNEPDYQVLPLIVGEPWACRLTSRQAREGAVKVAWPVGTFGDIYFGATTPAWPAALDPADAATLVYSANIAQVAAAMAAGATKYRLRVNGQTIFYGAVNVLTDGLS
jgi:hypothetical protein